MLRAAPLVGASTRSVIPSFASIPRVGTLDPMHSRMCDDPVYGEKTYSASQSPAMTVSRETTVPGPPFTASTNTLWRRSAEGNSADGAVHADARSIVRRAEYVRTTRMALQDFRS